MNPELEDLASRYVLDQLDSRERADFEARLLGSPELLARVRELESAYARIIRGLPQQEPPPHLLARIEARLSEFHEEGAPAGSVARFTKWTFFARWGIAATIAVGVATLAIQNLRRDTRPVIVVVRMDPNQSTLAELHLGTRGADSDARFIQLASLAEKYWQNPDALPVSLPASKRMDRAYAVFDPESNQGFIGVQQLPTPKAGTRYYVWIVDTVTHRIRKAGIVPLDGGNGGLFSFSIAPVQGEKSGRLRFFVTAEDNAGGQSATPHGRVVLGGKEI